MNLNPYSVLQVSNITSDRSVDNTTAALTTITTASSHSTQPSLNGTQDSSPMLESKIIPSRRPKFTPLNKKDIEKVKTFVIFAAIGRSGHSIVGSLMDAHPDMIIAHEYNILKHIREQLNGYNNPLALFNSIYTNSYRSAVRGWRSKKKVQKGYTLSMSHNSWQGGVRSLRVIGDKSGTLTLVEFKSDPTKCQYLVRELERSLGIPVKAIHVVRNPYDNIATKFLYDSMKAKNKIFKIPRTPSEIANFPKPTITNEYIEMFFEHVSTLHRMISDCHLPVLDVHLSDLINQPMSVMRDICDFVSVEYSVDYLEACVGKVFQSLSKTRSLVKWSQEQIDNVTQNTSRFLEFSRYSYDCDC